MTRNGVPSPADFRHCMEACEVASHVSRRFPTIHLKNRSCSFPVENLNRSQGTKRKRSKEADSSPIIVFKHISDQAEASTITPASSGNLGDTTPPRQLPRVRGDATRREQLELVAGLAA